MPVGVCVLDMVQGSDDLSGENDSCFCQVGSCRGAGATRHLEMQGEYEASYPWEPGGASAAALGLAR